MVKGVLDILTVDKTVKNKEKQKGFKTRMEVIVHYYEGDAAWLVFNELK